MGIMVYSLLWVMQDVYHQPYDEQSPTQVCQASKALQFVSTHLRDSLELVLFAIQQARQTRTSKGLVLGFRVWGVNYSDHIVA